MKTIAPEQYASVSGAMDLSGVQPSCNVYVVDSETDLQFQLNSCASDAVEYTGYQSTPTDIPCDAVAGP